MKNLKKKTLIKTTTIKTNIYTDLIRTNLRNKNRSYNKIFLDKNENLDLKLQKIIKNILSKIDIKLLNAYPDLSKLFKKISLFHKINSDNIYIGAGIDVILRGFFELFIKKNDLIILIRPTFAMYEIYAKIFKAKVKFVDYEYTLLGPTLNLKKIYNLINNHNPKALFLANPNSPTGTVIENTNLIKIIKLCKKKKVLLFLDEAYYLFYNKSYINNIKEFDNLIVARTFSKAWGLAGLRIGYALANKKIIDKFNSVSPMYPVNSVAIYVAENLLNSYSDIRQVVNQLIESKKYFLKELSSLGYKSYETYGNFCNVDFNGNEKNIFNKISKKFIYKRSFSHKSMINYSRFSLTDKKNFKKIIELIK